MSRYEQQLDIFQERRSFSKTDTDATFMRMKEDHMQNGQLKAGYNVQIGTEDQFVVSYTLHRRAGDTACMVDHLAHLKSRFGALPHTLVADAGYGSEENYSYLEGEDVRAFVKYNMFHKEQKRAFRQDPTQPKSWVFNTEDDSWTCTHGQKLTFLKDKQTTSDLGFKSTTRLYKCEDCLGCPHQAKCTKSDDEAKNRLIYSNPYLERYRTRAAKRLTSDEGVILRRRRATDVETVFGDIKHNWGFKRFTMRGLAKASLEWGLVALGHNMRKLHQALSGTNPTKAAPFPA